MGKKLDQAREVLAAYDELVDQLRAKIAVLTDIIIHLVEDEYEEITNG